MSASLQDLVCHTAPATTESTECATVHSEFSVVASRCCPCLEMSYCLLGTAGVDVPACIGVAAGT
jgi:hypothetical protein